MKFPRFHLSTLLLACVGVGAAIGTALAPPVWRPVRTIALSRLASEPQFNDHASSMAFNISGKSLFIYKNRQRVLYDVETGKHHWETHSWHTEGTPTGARFIDDGSIVGVTVELAYIKQTFERHFYYVDSGCDVKFMEPERIPELELDKREKSEDYTTRGITESFLIEKPAKSEMLLQVFDDNKLLHEYRHDTGRPAYSAAFSKDGKLLAVGHADCISIWRRSRDYGWRGLLDLPLFWVSFIAFALLLGIFGRWVLKVFRIIA